MTYTVNKRGEVVVLTDEDVADALNEVKQYEV